MDLTKPITYNSLTASNNLANTPGVAKSGYQWEQINISNEEVSAYFEKTALMDGDNASDVYLGRRTINGILGVYGSTRGDLWDKLQAALVAFSPTIAYRGDTQALGFLAFDFYRATANISSWPVSAYPNGIPQRFYARPSSPPTYMVRRDETGGSSSRGGSIALSVALVAKDPRKYLQTTDSAAVTLGVSGSTSTTAYKGDYPTLSRLLTSSATLMPTELSR